MLSACLHPLRSADFCCCHLLTYLQQLKKVFDATCCFRFCRNCQQFSQLNKISAHQQTLNIFIDMCLCWRVFYHLVELCYHQRPQCDLMVAVEESSGNHQKSWRINLIKTTIKFNAAQDDVLPTGQNFVLCYSVYISQSVLYYFDLNKEVESVLVLSPESFFHKFLYFYWSKDVLCVLR